MKDYLQTVSAVTGVTLLILLATMQTIKAVSLTAALVITTAVPVLAPFTF